MVRAVRKAVSEEKKEQKLILFWSISLKEKEKEEQEEQVADFICFGLEGALLSLFSAWCLCIEFTGAVIHASIQCWSHDSAQLYIFPVMILLS